MNKHFYFPRRWLWLWGLQTHKTYFCVSLGKFSLMLAWRPKL